MRTMVLTIRFVKTSELLVTPESVKDEAKAPLVESVIVVVEAFYATGSPVDPIIFETQVPRVASSPTIARKAVRTKRASRRLVTDLVNSNIAKATGLVDMPTRCTQRAVETTLVRQVVQLLRTPLKGAKGVGA